MGLLLSGPLDQKQERQIERERGMCRLILYQPTSLNQSAKCKEFTQQSLNNLPPHPITNKSTTQTTDNHSHNTLVSMIINATLTVSQERVKGFMSQKVQGHFYFHSNSVMCHSFPINIPLLHQPLLPTLRPC